MNYMQRKHTYQRCEEQPTQGMLSGPLPPVIERLGYTRGRNDNY